MPTQDDLHGAFALLEDRAPASCDIPLPRPARTRRYRFALPAAAAAAVTAVAVGVPVALSHAPAHHASPPAGSTHASSPASTTVPSARPAGFGQGIPAPKGATTLRLSFTVDDVPGHTVRGDVVNRTYQHATIDDDGGLYLFYRGGYVPSDALHGRHVNVNGHRGYLGTAIAPYPDGTHDDAAFVRTYDVPLDSIAWQYAPHSWALLTLTTTPGTHTRPDRELLELARAVRPGRQALAVPFRLTYLPAGLTAQGAMQGDPLYVGGDIGFSDGRSGVPGNVSRTVPPGPGGSALSVAASKYVSVPGKPFPDCVVGDGGLSPDDPAYDDQATPFNGGAGCAYYKHGAVTWIAVRQGGYAITVNVDGNHQGHYSEAQLRRIVDGMVLAPKIDDPGTWFDATTAVPR